MAETLWIPKFLLIALVLIPFRVNSQCEFRFNRRNKVFEFNLASSVKNHPHGALSEDGFYRVEANSTVLWFQVVLYIRFTLCFCIIICCKLQLCDMLIFNHDPPRCVGCQDCGGPSHCGTSCSALLSENVRGYDVCTSLGHASSSKVDVIDKEDPGKGIIVKMLAGSSNPNCSLSVSVICQKNKVDGPLTLTKSGTCDYATELRHPSGCAVAISGHGSGWGWFSTLLIIILCLFGAYLLGGSLYRYFSLGIRGIEVIPNSDFWVTVPHRIQLLWFTIPEIQGFKSWPTSLLFAGQLAVTEHKSSKLLH
ncbi:hypothetical protein HID58_058530 [Brassica napus]|uniref:Autophagy-related protein 27 n=1 Tax=Brassica napus TaxID=3708 RepID=A0ABQ7ZQ97_BRANA|nr:hypothetical protein HID58_058530 [Brassica napus]